MIFDWNEFQIRANAKGELKITHGRKTSRGLSIDSISEDKSGNIIFEVMLAMRSILLNRNEKLKKKGERQDGCVTFDFKDKGKLIYVHPDYVFAIMNNRKDA